MMKVPETRYAKAADGVSLAYHAFGDGPNDLLWLDGSRGNLEVMWEQPLVSGFFTKLAERCRVIRFDMRGTGLSDRGETGPILEAQIADAATVCDVVGSQLTTVVGHGWGCAAAALFATTYPRRTTGLALAAAQAKNRWTPDYPWGFGEEDWERAATVMRTGWGTEAYAAFVVSVSAPSLVRDREYLRWEAKMERHWLGPRAAEEIDRQFYDSDVTEVLRSVRVPCLVIARGWENPEEDEYVAGLVPEARLVRLPGIDWVMWAGDQEPVIETLWDFIGADHAVASPTTSLQTVLFTDIVGSTERAIALGDRGWHEQLERHHAIVRARLARYAGREVDTAGDGFFAIFDGPARAIRCAMDIVDAVRPIDLEVRAGIHTGEVELAGDTVRGIAVHIGARVSSLAGASEVLVSSTVKDLVAGSGLAFEDAGDHELKGVPDPWHLFRVAT